MHEGCYLYCKKYHQFSSNLTCEYLIIKVGVSLYIQLYKRYYYYYKDLNICRKAHGFLFSLVLRYSLQNL